MKARYAIVAIAAMFMAMSASAVDLHGYFRSAVGGSSKGGDQWTFGNSDQGYKLRLGNEDNWSEFEFVQLIQKDKNGVEWTAGFMLGWGNGFTADNGFSGPNALQQEYIRATFPQLSGATVWGGKRFYHRHANDIFDYFYMNESGPGVGIEDIDVGFGKLSGALFRFSPDGNSGNKVFWMPDFRLEGIPVNPGGTLNVALLAKLRSWNKEIAGSEAPDKTSDFAVHAMVKHSQSGILNGGNNFAIDFKTTCFISNDCNEKDWKLTVSEDLLIQPTKQFSINFAAIFMHDNVSASAGDPATFPVTLPRDEYARNGIGVGVRPFFKVADHFGLGGDVGYFWNKTDEDGAEANTMFKITFAPTVTPFTDGFAWGVRPEIRFYITYASWNEEQNPFGTHGDGKTAATAKTPNTPFGDDNNGVTFGTQVETWF